MVEAVSNPGTLSVIRRFRPHADLQGIRADYYNLTESARRAAGRAACLDGPTRTACAGRNPYAQHRCRRPVRDRPCVRPAASSPTATTATDQSPLPLRVELDSDPLSVQPQGVQPPCSVERCAPWEQGGIERSPPAGVRPAPRSFCALRWLFLNEWLSGDLTGSGASSTVRGGSSSADVGDDGLIVQTNGLPPSRNAIPMKVGRPHPASGGVQDNVAHASWGTVRRHCRTPARRQSYDDSQRPDLAARQQRYDRLVVCAIG